MFSLLKALTIIVSLLIITGCDLTSLDDTALTFSMETDQDNLQAIAIMGADTLLVLDSSGTVSASVSSGDQITVWVYVEDISGEVILYTTREFTIEEKSLKYRI